MKATQEVPVQFDSKLFGEMCYRAACERLKHIDQSMAPLDVLADSLAEGTKTAQRFRKGTHHPTFEQIISLVGDLKDPDVRDFLVATINASFNS